MNHLKTLVVMQLRDKIDLGWIKNKKEALRKVILSLVKFLVITTIIYIILSLCNRFGIFLYDESPRIMVLVLTISLALSFVSCTVELMKNLYFAEDNRVLITLPVRANQIFISKIIVFYVYELKKSFSLLIPISLSCITLLFTQGYCSFWVYIWMWIPLLFIVALPVLLGAIFSIPVLYIYRFLKKNAIIEFIVFLLVLAGLIWLAVYLIGLIPENIDLINQWPTIRNSIREFLLLIEQKLFVMNQLIRIMIGEQLKGGAFSIHLLTIGKFAVLIGISAILFFISYFASRPLFFVMMAKNFELNKSNKTSGKNKKHGHYLTFVNKEFKINLRTIDISINYLMVYIIVPILILLLNAIYKAMDTRELGNWLIYTFNVLLICLPLLASNALISTYYSREGRAGYMKKTKPIDVAYPLLAKLFFNVLFSIPSVFATVAIFGHSVQFHVGDIILFGFAILFLHIGHMVYSATLDIIHPQNEQYATTGVSIDNPNENKSTGLAFIISIIYAVVAYKLLSEASLYNNDLTIGFVKLLLISLVIFGSSVYMFFKKIKAYYYEIQG